MGVLASGRSHIPFGFNEILTPMFRKKLIRDGSNMKYYMDESVVRGS